MDLGLKGKGALAAASSAGIGRAVAEARAAEGADLVICGQVPSGLLGEGTTEVRV